MALRNLTLDRLMLWTGYGILAVFFLPLTLLVLWWLPLEQERALIEKTELLLSRLADSLIDPILTNDRYSTGRILRNAVEDSGENLYALLMDAGNRVFAHTFEKGIPDQLHALLAAGPEDTLRFESSDGPLINVSWPIMQGRLGRIHLGVSRQSVIRSQHRILLNALVILAAALLVLVVGTRWVSRMVSRPLSELEEQTRKRMPLEAESPSTWNRSGTVEVRNIAVRFLNLLQQLESMEKVLPPGQRQVFREERETAVQEMLKPSPTRLRETDGDIWSEAYLKDRYAWLVFHRWIALAFISLTWLAYQMITTHVNAHWPTFTIVMSMAAWNGFMELGRRRPEWLFGRSVQFWLLMQILSDLLALSLLLHYFGGIENPFKVLYVFLVVIAALMFTIRVSSLIALFGSLLYGGIIFAEFMSWIPHHPLMITGTQEDPGTWNQPFVVLGDGLGMTLVLIGVVFFIHAVSRKRREAESARKAAEHVAISRERMAILGELAAGVAHEIRNPIHGMMNCCDLLQQENATEEEVKELTALLDEGLRRINTIADRLLRIGHARVVEKGAVHMEELVHSTVELVRQTARKKRVEIEVEVKKDIATIWGNADRLSEALLNLLTNSLDACEEGGRIRVRLEHVGTKDGGIRLAVSDTGDGISSEILPRIFNPFFTTKAAGQGSGLGLSLVDETVRFHGGSIEVASTPGAGTTMIITLPPAKKLEDFNLGVDRHETSPCNGRG